MRSKLAGSSRGLLFLFLFMLRSVAAWLVCLFFLLFLYVSFLFSQRCVLFSH